MNYATFEPRYYTAGSGTMPIGDFYVDFRVRLHLFTGANVTRLADRLAGAVEDEFGPEADFTDVIGGVAPDTGTPISEGADGVLRGPFHGALEAFPFALALDTPSRQGGAPVPEDWAPGGDIIGAG